MTRSYLLVFFLLFILGGCASRMKDEMKSYREAFARGSYTEAGEILKKSQLKTDQKAQLLWHLEQGTLALSQGNESESIQEFIAAIELIDQLYTKKLSAKAQSFLINDASDVFYGASYERSYAYYYLSRAYYARYLKTQARLDLQGARATILAWDSYFQELQRSAAPKTIYQTDLMLKVFGGQIHEVSEIRNDKQIALQLYKDALGILDSLGGALSVFNEKHADFIKQYEESLAQQKLPPQEAFVKTSAWEKSRDFLHYKILSLTKEIRPQELGALEKKLTPTAQVKERLKLKSNTVILVEEGLIPQKVGRPFNFGLKGAMSSSENSGARAFIATVGWEALTAFAMKTLGITPSARGNNADFIFGYHATKLAVAEAAISFELPMIEAAPRLGEFDVVVMDEKGSIIQRAPLAIVSENGDIARVVLEEDVVSRYAKTGARVALKHLLAIVASMQIYQKLKGNGELIAKTAAMATYVASSKSIAAMEEADTRHWTTLPRTFRMEEFNLPQGKYTIALSSPDSSEGAPSPALKVLGDIQVSQSGKVIHTFRLK
jgi:hypothetical protein